MVTLVPEELTVQIRAKQGAAIRSARGNRTRRDVIRAMEAEGATATESALAWWEAGERRPSEAASLALARALGVAWSDLFSLDGEVA
jgi:transcriptional regulator with XRE-family HTH domain